MMWICSDFLKNSWELSLVIKEVVNQVWRYLSKPCFACWVLWSLDADVQPGATAESDTRGPASPLCHRFSALHPVSWALGLLPPPGPPHTELCLWGQGLWDCSGCSLWAGFASRGVTLPLLAGDLWEQQLLNISGLHSWKMSEAFQSNKSNWPKCLLWLITKQEERRSAEHTHCVLCCTKVKQMARSVSAGNDISQGAEFLC